MLLIIYSLQKNFDLFYAMWKIVRAADVVTGGLEDAIPPLFIEIESEEIKFKITVKRRYVY